MLKKKHSLVYSSAMRIVAVALSLGYMACPEPLQAAPKTLVYCSESSPENFTPALSEASFSFDAQRPIFNQLLTFKPGSFDIAPSLAETWSLNEDGTVITFKLRRNVKFHSGVNGFIPSRPFTADDVLFSFNRQWQNHHPYHKISSNDSYRYFSHMGFKDTLKSIEKEDDYTVHFTLTTPSPSLLANFAMDFSSIHSAEYADYLMQKGQAEDFDFIPVGTGPFQFVSYNPDERIEFKAFRDHWSGRPRLDKLTFSITPDPKERSKKLQNNLCQIMVIPDPIDIPRLREDPALTVLSTSAPNIGYLAYNVTKKPFDDIRVRQAISAAIDQNAIIQEAYNSLAIPASGLLPPGMLGHNTQTPTPVFNVEQAKSLVKEAAITLPLKIDLFYIPIERDYNPDSKSIAEIIRNNLAKIGIQANLRTHDWDEYRRNLQKGEFDLAQFGWVTDNGDPHSFFAQLSCKGAQGGQNISRWCNESFEELLDQGRTQTDRHIRERIYKNMGDIVARELPWYSIAHTTINVPIRKTVVGYHISPLRRHDFHLVDLKN